MKVHEALYWEYNEKTGKVNCLLCPQNCHISNNNFGLCKTRKNIDNHLCAINYGVITSMAMDPIEKKPLYHYKPGKEILSVGTFGCNMKCQFCQNYAISQNQLEGEKYEPFEIVNLIKNVENNIGIAFTYNEPFIWYEYVYDVCKMIKDNGLNKDVVLVTNGYVNPKPLEKLLPYVSAMNIDLKSFSNHTYQKLCKATLNPVLETIKTSSEKCHVEVTTLLVTDENDSLEEVEQIAKYVASINPDIVLHLSRYFPNYHLLNKPTDIEFMKKARDVALRYLNYVYIGNIMGIDNNTYCPHCQYLLVSRHQYEIIKKAKSNECPNCHQEIPMII